MSVGPDRDEPKDSELCVAVVECRLKRARGSEFFIRFSRAREDESPQVIGIVGPFAENVAKDAFAKWLAGNAASMARGESIGIPTMMDIPEDVQRALREWNKDD